MNAWLAVVIVCGWLALSIAAGVLIGAMIRRRDSQRPRDTRPPRGNVDLTTAIRPVVRDVPPR